MRGHLRSIVVLVILTLAAFLVVRSAIAGRDPRRDPPPGPETIEAAMAPLGYRRVAQTPGWAEALILVDTVYAHCEAGEACDGERGDLAHPTVALTGAGVTAVYLRGTLSAQVCFSVQQLAPPVTDPRWQEYVRAVAVHAILGPRVAGPSADTSINVERDGWRCLSVPRPEVSPS